MIVSPDQVESTVQTLLSEPFLSLDTETFGLGWGDKLFSIVIGSSYGAYYFNFLDKPDHLGVVAPVVLNELQTIIKLQPLFNEVNRCWFMHNAKYDLRRCDLAGFNLHGRIHDTEVVARLLRNDHMEYNLAAVAEREGFQKDDAVEKYIKEHKLYEMAHIPGKQKREQNKKFYLVPFSIMAPYGERDADITYKIGMKQLHALDILQ